MTEQGNMDYTGEVRSVGISNKETSLSSKSPFITTHLYLTYILSYTTYTTTPHNRGKNTKKKINTRVFFFFLTK